MTTVDEALTIALKLTPEERQELIERVASSLEQTANTPPVQEEHWGKKLSALLNAMNLTDWDNADIDDPVAWVKAQREKDLAGLDDYWNGTR